MCRCTRSSSSSVSTKPRSESGSATVSSNSRSSSWASESDSGSGVIRSAAATCSSVMPVASASSAAAGFLAAALTQRVARPFDCGGGVAHASRHADRAALLGDGATDGLAYPPRRVGGELVTPLVVELLHGADEAEVALLHEIEQRHAGALVALGDVHHEPQVRHDEHLLGVVAGAHRVAEPTLLCRRHAGDVARMFEGGGGELAGCDERGEAYLVVRRQQFVHGDLA